MKDFSLMSDQELESHLEQLRKQEPGFLVKEEIKAAEAGITTRIDEALRTGEKLMLDRRKHDGTNRFEPGLSYRALAPFQFERRGMKKVS